MSRTPSERLKDAIHKHHAPIHCVVESSSLIYTHVIPLLCHIFPALPLYLLIIRFSRQLLSYNLSFAATPLPHVKLVSSNLHSVSICWSVNSPQDVTSYVVVWLKESVEVDRSKAFNRTTYHIEGLNSNTAYQILVQAFGPLGKTDSYIQKFYTTPVEISGMCFQWSYINTN